MFGRKKPTDKPDMTTDSAARIDPVEIEIFKAGKHRGMTGKEFTFSQIDVEQIAEAFDADLSPVPVVVGHPKTDAPAYAWAEAVYAEGDTLKARIAQIDPAFAEIVKAGRYKRISCAFFPPDADNNPAQGQYYLRHIGFLGAAAPAVKGLKPVEFNAESDWICFGELDAEAVAAKYERELRELKAERKLETLVEQGKVLACFKDDLACFVGALDDGEIIAFSDGAEATRADWFMDYLTSQPAVVPMSEIVQDGEMPLTAHPQFTAPDGHDLDREGLEKFDRAQQIMREQNVTFEDAVDMIYGD